MAQWLRQNSAVVIHVGPAVATGGLGTVSALLASKVTKLAVIKHGTLGSVGPTSVTGRTFKHKGQGHYSLSLLSGDTDTLGHFTVYVSATGTTKALPFWHKFHVVPQNVYDSLVSGSAKLNVGTLASGGAVWTATPRTLTSGLQVASSVWNKGTRTLTSGSVIWTAAQTELTAVPAAAPNAGPALMFLYMSARNKRITTATGDKIHNSATTAIATAPISASSITFTKSKYA